jgi:hypothetical protein
MLGSCLELSKAERVLVALKGLNEDELKEDTRG